MDTAVVEKWEKFYETVGGRYICNKCGAILTQEQMLKAGNVSVLGWAITLVVALFLTLLGGIIFYYFAPRNGCPICKAKKDEIIPLNSQKGLEVFKEKHPEFANLTEGLVLENE